ncbi:MAG TPA: VTT domain-containing protein, partial [Alphaproteobacteria bacterium]|nr:VTT domain-containing protein [Alphaproteobacteria bacterium]
MGTLLQPGHNCWRVERARRGAFLIDAAAYFLAVKRALLQAKHQVLIVGWDIDSRFSLDRTGEIPEAPSRFIDLLQHIIARRPSLQVHILLWDYAMLYALDREPLPRLNLSWRSPRQIRLRLDNTGPLGIAHHQKLVVVDDSLAFAGGIDLTDTRWDRPGHAPDDPLRVDFAGWPYAAFHDVQAMVDGEAAQAMGELARNRWRVATGEGLAPPPRADVWPDGVEPDFTDADVAIARTYPRYPDWPEVREIEQLHVDSIAAARRHIYLENQYLTSLTVQQALVERLGEPDGPDVVIVAPRHTKGWLEEECMGAGRDRFMAVLRRADRHGRVREYAVALGDGSWLNVHSKVTVIDDRLVRVGSSNLNNRSMGFDSECDIALEAGEGERALRGVITGLRDRLLAEHLDVAPEDFAAEVARRGSLIDAIEALRRDEGHTLVPVEREPGSTGTMVEPLLAFADPEEPLALNDLLHLRGGEGQPQSHPGLLHRLMPMLALCGLVIVFAALWRFTPLSEYVQIGQVERWLASWRSDVMAPALVAGLYLFSSLVVFPITVVIAATGLVFGAWPGLGYAFGGSLLGAVATYGIGLLLGKHLFRHFKGTTVERLSQRVGRRGVLAVTTLRLLPLAPFALVNIAAGASHVRFRDFVFGTLLGMAPGISVVTLLGDRLPQLLQRPSLENFLIVGAILLAWTVLALGSHALAG